MRTGNSEGLGDPGVKGVLLKLADPHRYASGTSGKGTGPLLLRHLQVIAGPHDGRAQEIMLIAFNLKKPLRLGEVGAQSDRSFLGRQPLGHLDSKIRLEGLSLPMRLVALSDGPVALLAGHAALQVKSFFGLACLIPLPTQPIDQHGILAHPLLKVRGPILSLPPKTPLRLQLVQDLSGPLTGLDILLDQLVPLLFDSGGLLLVQLHPHR